MARTHRNIVERLERSALEMKDGECWETSRRGVNGRTTGYGHTRIKPEWNVGSQTYIHRVAWEMHHAEPIPPGMQVLHTCDNPRCFNPEHLYLGTPQDNIDDQVSRKRAHWQ